MLPTSALDTKRPACLAFPPMEAILTVGAPVFAIMGLGWMLGRFGLFGPDATRALNGFVFYATFPALIFISLATTPIEDSVDGPLVAAFSAGFLGTFSIAFVSVALLTGGRTGRLAVLSAAAVFANTGYLGVPLMDLAYGERGLVPSLVVTAVTAAIFIGTLIVLIEIDRSSGGLLGGLRAAAVSMTTNPLILAAAAGLTWSLAGWPVPAPIETFCRLLGAATGPAALFATGLFLVGKQLGGQLPLVAWLAGLKLLAMPVIAWTLADPVLGMPPVETSIAVILAAMPTGSLVFIISHRYGIEEDVVAATTLATSLGSALTVAALLVVFGVG